MKFLRGDLVQKTDGDYTIQGRILEIVNKYDRALWSKSDEIRYVVQTTQGMLLVMHERQLEPWNGQTPPSEGTDY